MESKIIIFESGIDDGIMSRNPKFYKDDIPQEKIDQIFLQTRLKLGEKYGFNGKKIFQANQKTPTNGVQYPDGKYIVLNDKNMQKDDYWYEDLPADILIISSDYPNIVVGNQMADCPILIAEDRFLGVTALAHCGVSYIDRKLPIQTIEALKKEYHSNLSNIYAYITSCASKENYVYDCYPKWAINKEVWQGSIIEEEGNYHIDMLHAIIKQLTEIGITNIAYSEEDTVTSPQFYSNNATSKGIFTKKGQNFVGFYYKNNGRNR